MNPVDLHHHAAIIQKQGVACPDVVHEFLVVESDLSDVAQRAVGVKSKGHTGFERNFALGEFADTDLGPLKVGEYADTRPHCSAIRRTRATVSVCAAALPCEKFIRTTSTPARIMRSSTSGEDDAGPSVATILVARGMALLTKVSIRQWANQPGGAILHERYRLRLVFLQGFAVREAREPTPWVAGPL